MATIVPVNTSVPIISPPTSISPPAPLSPSPSNSSTTTSPPTAQPDQSSGTPAPSSPSNSAPPPQSPRPATPSAPPPSPPLSPPPMASPPPSPPTSPPPSPPPSPLPSPPPSPPQSPPPVANSPPPPPPSEISPPPPPPSVASPPPPTEVPSPPSSDSPPPPVAKPTEKSPPPPPRLTPSSPSGSPPAVPPPKISPPPPGSTSSPPPPSVPSSSSPTPTSPPAPPRNSSVSGTPPISSFPSLPTEKPTATSGSNANSTSNDGGGIGPGGTMAIGIVFGVLVLSLVVMAVWLMRKRKRGGAELGGGYVMPSPFASSQNSAVKALVLALDVFTGTVLWQRSIGPLRTPDCAAVVDSNGWISIGSLDGFIYSFSPTGVLKKFPKAAALDSVIQVSPLLDCSGYAVYLSQTVMEGKTSHTIGEYSYISALKPLNVVFTLLVPATGSIYWSKSYSELGQFSSVLSESDLQHFVVDEGILLAFITASNIGSPLPCRSTRQKLASSCSQAEPKHVSIYAGNERAIVLFLIFESAILIVIVVVVHYCCIFWRKKKLQGQNLGKFLEKRRSLRLQKKAFDRTITEIGQKAAEKALEHEMLEKLGDLVKQKEGIERKLSTTYSLGRDRTSSKPKSLLPLYDGKTKSYSFQGAKKESFTMFHTLSDTSSADSSSEREVESNLFEYKASAVKAKAKAKAKAPSEDDSSSDDETSEDYEGTPSGSRGFVNPLFVKHDFDESKEVKMEGESGSSSIRKRTLSSTN
ncbi:gamete-expressed 3 [Actinidia rufa]|uniref:Gamete-expressed 3 n=1 Tax=Actinidia rufa TaxID=165716 RepID=A0A7J0H7A5_9ERIC|nr:gamete-expressed 3 [Actinidia rufa]